jgi:hypothetical protein
MNDFWRHYLGHIDYTRVNFLSQKQMISLQSFFAKKCTLY